MGREDMEKTECHAGYVHKIHILTGLVIGLHSPIHGFMLMFTEEYHMLPHTAKYY